jgi:hypothetical protein
MLAIVAGGIAGGAAAVVAPGVLAPASPVVVASSVETQAVLDRKLAEVEAPAAIPATSLPAGSSAAVAAPTTTAPAPSIAEQAVAPAQTAATTTPGAGGCPANLTGSTSGAPGTVSAGGVAGTTTADLDAFAAAFNAQRVANCLAPVPLTNFRYDACMEQRLFWMAEDPSNDPASAWGHVGSVRSDGVPSVGCDGNIAGGMNNVGATFARKWWDSMGHRISLYTPSYTGSMNVVCIYFAVTHGGVPDEPVAFARAAARWDSCTARLPGERLSARAPGLS